jgi:hypothetical protein
MQTPIDPRTLVVTAVFVALVPTAIAALVWKTRPTYPGFGRWTVGNMLDTFCLVLLSLRGTAPDWISIVLANAAALGAGILYLQGSRKFRGLRVRWWPEFATGILGVAGVIYFRYVSDSIGARTAVSGVALGSLGLACGITILEKMPAGRRFGMVLTGIIFTLTAGVEFFRGFYMYMYNPSADVFAPSAINALFFVGAGLVAVGWTFGFLLMTEERLWQDAGKLRDGAASAARMSPAGMHASGATVPEAEVRRQLQRIVVSDIFRRSARMERFLSLAVDRALIGQPEKLKEYALGRDVFDRDEDYDPRTDSIVRVEAQRLRRKVREYYKSYGRDDLVIVEFHSGSYVPLFRYRELEETKLPKSIPASSNR